MTAYISFSDILLCTKRVVTLNLVNLPLRPQIDAVLPLMDDELIHTDEQRIPILEMESTLDEDAMKIVEMIRKDLEYYLKLADKATARFEQLTPILMRFYLDKMLSVISPCYRRMLSFL